MAAGTEPPDLEERVAALEELARHPLRSVHVAPMSNEDAAKFRDEFDQLAGDQYRQQFILPSAPPLTPEQVRQVLRECVTVVKPGETLVIRVPATWNPMQVREYAEAVYDGVEYLDLPFKAFVVTGDELAVAEPEAADG